MTPPVDTTDPDEPRSARGTEDSSAAVPDSSAAVPDLPAGMPDRGADSGSAAEVEDLPQVIDASEPAAVEEEARGGEAAGPGTAPESALARASAREVASAVCPYLASAGGAWRMATPSRDHRCVGLQPPVPQPPDKQRRHCLSPAHVECGIYRAARDVRTVALAGGTDPARIVLADATRRPLPRTAPILLEPPRLLDQATRLRLDRAPGQLALAGLMIVAFGVVGLSRLSGPPSAQPSTAPTSIAVVPSKSVRPSSSAVIRPSASASALASASAVPAASFRTTYTVKKGDTLNTVAVRFKTTAAAISRLNNLKSSALRIGQVLKIP